MARRTGILHIGLPKTATTSFQNAVHSNRERLLSDFGIFYPSIEPNHTNALCTMFLPDPRMHVTMKVRGITDAGEAEKVRADYFRKMEQDIESTGWDTLVLSAEGVCNMSSPSLSDLRTWAWKYVDNWRVLFWSRHPVTYTASVMQQLIKNGRYIEEMMENPPLPNFKGRLTNAFTAFGRSAVELTAFEQAAEEPGGVVGAFCRRIGVDEAVALEIAESANRENESLSLLATFVLDSLNRQRPYFVDGKIAPNRRNGEVPYIQKIKGPRFDLPAEAKDTIRRASRPDVDWLNSTFKTNLYTDVFSDGMDSHVGPADLVFKEAIDSLAMLISDLINRVVKH